MICIVWEFRVRAGHEQEFERHYCGHGTWAELFRRSASYLGTDLVRDIDDPQRYLTFDKWADLASYERFRSDFVKEYEALDAQMEDMTVSERKVGVFADIESGS